MLRPSAQRLSQQVGRGGAIARGRATSFGREDRKLAKCGNYFATEKCGRRETPPIAWIGLERANPPRKPKANYQRFSRKRGGRVRLGVGVTTLVLVQHEVETSWQAGSMRLAGYPKAVCFHRPNGGVNTARRGEVMRGPGG